MQLKTIVSGIAALALVAALAINVSAEEKEEGGKSLTLADVPAAAQAAIQQFAGTNSIQKIKKESEDGKVIFEAKVTIDGVKQEIEVSPDGTVLATERQVTLGDVPKLVRVAIKQFAGDGSIDRITEETEGGKKNYEAKVTVNGEKKEADISPDGKISEDEEEKGEQKEGGKGKD